MQEVTINGKKRLCYIVKRGEVNDIVVPVDSLADVDIRRFHKMESEGGELMRVMRDTTLDNGMNALETYKFILRSVEVVKAPAQKKAQEVSVLDVQKFDAPSNPSAPSTPKRSRGRPKTKKTK